MIFRKKSKEGITNLNYEKKIAVPKTAQDTIPFIEAYDNGLLLVDDNAYTLIFSFENLDYSLLREEEQRELYDEYMKLMNALPIDISYQEFIMNDSINIQKLHDAMIPQDLPYNDITDDYKAIMEEKVKQSALACADKIMLVALTYRPQTSVENANVLFKYFREIQSYFSRLKVETRQLMPEEIFRILHRYYHPFDDDEFLLPTNFYSRGGRIKDYIAPSMFAFKPKEVEVGEAFTRVLYVQRYDRDMDDEFIKDLCDNNFRIAVSKQIQRHDKGYALDRVKKEIFDVQTQIQKRMEDNHKRGGNFIPFSLSDKLKELEDLQERLAGSMLELFQISIFISISARTKDELDELTKAIKTRASKHQVVLNILTRQQEKALQVCCRSPIISSIKKTTTMFRHIC